MRFPKNSKKALVDFKDFFQLPKLAENGSCKDLRNMLICCYYGLLRCANGEECCHEVAFWVSVEKVLQTSSTFSQPKKSARPTPNTRRERASQTMCFIPWFSSLCVFARWVQGFQYEHPTIHMLSIHAGSAGHRRLTIFAGGVPLLLQPTENCNIRWNIAGPLLTIDSKKRIESVFWYDASFSRTAWHPPDRSDLAQNSLRQSKKSQQATLSPRVASLRLVSTHGMPVPLSGDRRSQTQPFLAGQCLTWPDP